jgi:hypothetical protein
MMMGVGQQGPDQRDVAGVDAQIHAYAGADGLRADTAHAHGRRLDDAHPGVQAQQRHAQPQIDQVAAVGDGQSGFQDVQRVDLGLQGSGGVAAHHVQIQHAAIAEQLHRQV